MSIKGFTLVELLVAITILAIISSIGLVFYNQAEVTARNSRRAGDLQEAQKALEQFYAIWQKYPADGTFYTDVDLPAYFQAKAVPIESSIGREIGRAHV